MDNTGPYFYVNSIVKSNEVITAFYAYAMQSKRYIEKPSHKDERKLQRDVEMTLEDQIPVNSEVCNFNSRGYEKHLVVVKPFGIEFYSVDGTKLDPVTSYPVNSKIWGCIKVPIWLKYPKLAENQREMSSQNYSQEGNEHDLIFFVTNKSDCVLVTFGAGNVKEVSKVVLEAADFPQIELSTPPLFYHSGEKDKVIGALLHRNLLHIIPIILQNGQHRLSDPVTVAIGESSIEDLTALNSGYTREKLMFACVEHQPRSITTEYSLNVYEIDQKDTISQSNNISPFNRDFTEKFNVVAKFSSDTMIYKICSLPFGGMLAFTNSKVMYFSNSDLSTQNASDGFLKGISRVNSVEFIDSMIDPQHYDKPIFRVIFSTESGQIYLIIFKMEAIANDDPFELLNLSELGKVNDVQTLCYLNDGNFFAGTPSGYIIGKLDSFKIVAQSEECSSITHMALVDKNEYDPKELVISTRQSNSSKFSIFRRGITLETLQNTKLKGVSYLNNLMLGSTNYLVMSLYDTTKIFKLSIDNEESKLEETFEDDSNFELREVHSVDHKLLYTSTLGENNFVMVFDTKVVVMSQSFKEETVFANDQNVFNTLVTGDTHGLIILMSNGNFHTYLFNQPEGLIVFKEVYVTKEKRDSVKNEAQTTKNLNSDLEREISCIHVFENKLLMTFWDTQKVEHKDMIIVSRSDLNHIVSKVYFNIKEVVDENTMMDIDATESSKMQYKDYTYSIVSMEVVKYHDKSHYLLCGTDHGYLYTFNFHPEEKFSQISNVKVTALGCNPVYLYSMGVEKDSLNKLRKSVFAMSNTSWVIYPWNDKIQYSPLSIPNITHFCFMNTEYPKLNELCILTTPHSLVIGSISRLAKLQKTSHSLGYVIGKFEYLKNIDTYVGLFDDYVNDSYTSENKSMVALFDFSSMSQSKLDNAISQEIVFKTNHFAVDFVTKTKNETTYVYVLTVDLESAENNYFEKRGSIICYEVVKRGISQAELVQLCQYDIDDGALNCIQNFKDDYIVCGSNKICIFDVSDPENISLECSQSITDICHNLYPLGDDRFVCSYMTPNSSLFHVEITEPNRRYTIKPCGNDYDCESAGIIYPYDKSKYLMAEHDGTLRLNEINLKPRNDDEKFRVFTRGRFNTHTQVSCIIPGYMRKKQDKIFDCLGLDHEIVEKNSFIFGSACGQISTLQTIPQKEFQILSTLENIMSLHYKGLGDFDQISFRMNNPFDDPYEKLEVLDCHKLSKRFIDGDFLSIFNSLPNEKQIELVDSVNNMNIDEEMNNFDLDVETVLNLIKSLMIV